VSIVQEEVLSSVVTTVRKCGNGSVGEGEEGKKAKTTPDASVLVGNL
jgi:hypothetical protein